MLQATFLLTYRLIKRIVIGVVGTTVVIIGIIMIVTPGPAIVVIPIGLAILGLEFAWARRWLKVVRDKTEERLKKAKGDKFTSVQSSDSDPGPVAENSRDKDELS